MAASKQSAEGRRSEGNHAFCVKENALRIQGAGAYRFVREEGQDPLRRASND